MMDQHYLTPLFSPASVVVFAEPANEGGIETALTRKLHASLHAQRFVGTLQHLDIQTSGTLADLANARADLAIIALPPQQIATALEVAVRMTCRSAVVISTGISTEHAAELKAIAHRGGVRLLGPNGLGFQRPKLQLNAGLIGPLAAAGSLALVSQSGALTASMLDWASKNGVGFSTVVSLGPDAVVDIAQVLDYFGTDRETRSIIVYLEGISSARCFMSALRSAAIAKPTVVLKAGRQPAGNEAAHTHSRAIVGSDDVFDAALRRAGAVRVRSFVELFSAAKCLASRYRPVGRRLAIVTNGGGPGVLAADWVNAISLDLGRLSPESAAGLQPLVPALASLTGLIDLSEDAGSAHYVAAVEAASRDSAIDGVLTIFSPKSDIDGTEIARGLVEIKQAVAKPLLSCWMGDASVHAARAILNDAGIPSFRTPEAAVGAFGNIATYVQNQQLLQQTPSPSSTLAEADIEGARLIIEGVLAERRSVLTEMESKTLLSSFHIPITRTLLARSPNEAVMIASQLGFPVALKVDSSDVTHKSDVMGVILGVTNGAGARDAYNAIVEQVRERQPDARINGVTVQRMAEADRGREIFIGLTTDVPFGPVIVFGAGGTMIELMDDRAMELPPLNTFLARRLIERSRVARTLGAWRGAAPVDMAALEQILLRVSEMVCELPQLREMDINPIVVDASGAVAVDARIVVDHASPTGSGRSNQYAHLAILPYPAHLDQVWPLAGGDEYTLRPIHPDDAQMLKDFVERLSPESRSFRFVSTMNELPPSMLARFTLIDYDREMALVATVHDRNGGRDDVPETERIIGVSRYVTSPDQSSCEFALAVADEYHGKGIGSRLMERIMDSAREKGLSEMHGLVLANNSGMLKLVKRLGFVTKSYVDDSSFRLVTHRLD